MSKHEPGSSLYAGIDGGATRSRCFVASRDGEVVGHGEAGPANPLRVGIDTAVESLTDSVNRALHEAEAAQSDLAAACFGVAGTRRGTVGEDLAAELKKNIGVADVTVVTDARAAFTGGVPDGVGVVALAGTGFVAFGMNRRGMSRYADGLGPLLGDEGSAYSLGYEALRSVARELDWRGPTTRFTDLVLESLQIKDLDSLLRLASKGALDTTRIAALAPLVLSACDSGSSVAGLIVEVAASRISDSVRVVAVDLELTKGKFHVVLWGGLFEEVNPLRMKVEELITGGIPGALVMRPLMPPAAGALAIAMSGRDSLKIVGNLAKLRETEEAFWS